MRTRRFAPQPAILGGPPAFDAPVPIVKPKLPPWNDVVDDLKSAYGSGRLSNFGPYCCALEDRVRSHLAANMRSRFPVEPSACMWPSPDSPPDAGRWPSRVSHSRRRWIPSSPTDACRGLSTWTPKRGMLRRSRSRRESIATLRPFSPSMFLAIRAILAQSKRSVERERSQLFTMQRTPSGPHTEIVLLARTDCAACSA